MSERLEYNAFYELLANTVTSGETCTIFGRTDSNHSVIIGLDRGRVVCLRCGAKKGMDAVAKLRETQWGTFRIDDTLIELHSAPPPPTADLIAALHPATTPSSLEPDLDASERQVEPTREARLLCDLLSRYVGPVAPLLCSEQISVVGGLNYRGQLGKVLGQLAQEIDDASEAAEFVSTAHREIGPLLFPDPQDTEQTVAPQTITEKFDAVQAASALCSIVADYLGPVAPIVCEDKIAEVGGLKGRQEIESTIRKLAGEIGANAEAEQFVARARKTFKTILG